MFRGHVRRSGTKRSVWYHRERKRRPLGPRPPTDLVVVPRPSSFGRPGPTEAEWLSGNPRTMLSCLVRLATDRGIVFHLSARAVQRKFRLFYCACCRSRWNLLPELAREVVEVVERYTDGHARAKALRAARRTAEAVDRAARPAWRPGGYTQHEQDVLSAVRLALDTTEIHTRLRSGIVLDGSPVGVTEQVTLLRDLFDNPFRPNGVADEWRTRTVLSLARVIHVNGQFDLMPFLGDALQDAGCSDAAVLDHCYGPESHARGCWLLDGILGVR